MSTELLHQDALSLSPPPRDSPLDPPPLLLELQRIEPVARVRLFDDGEASRMLAPEFVVKCVMALAPTITTSFVELVDAMRSKGPGVDLIETLGVPVPALVTCAMLGVPDEQRDYVVTCVDTFLGGHSTPEQVLAGRADLRGFLAELIALRTDEPGEDLISRVIVEQVLPGRLTAEQLVGFAELVLAAGFDTTHNTIGLGTLALLRNPEQLALLRSDPTLIDGAVEEILRYLVARDLGRHRVASEDVELLAAANRDPAVFAEPNRLDITRKGQPHLGFGYGVHQCLGAMFARIELRAVFSLLFDRMPSGARGPVRRAPVQARQRRRRVRIPSGDLVTARRGRG